MGLRIEPPSLRIDVYDPQLQQWRSFAVVPFTTAYAPRCGNGLHQFQPSGSRCACGDIDR